jgi:hypothetical protein
VKKIIAAGVLLLGATGCAGGTWDYHATPLDGAGRFTDSPNCFSVEAQRTKSRGFLGMDARTYTFQKGLFCKKNIEVKP